MLFKNNKKNKYIAEHFVFKLTSFFRKHILNPKILLLIIRMCYSVAKYKAKIHYHYMCLHGLACIIFIFILYKVKLIQVNDC